MPIAVSAMLGRSSTISAFLRFLMPVDQRSDQDRRRDQHPKQERLRSIVERMADGVVIVDLAGSIRFANPAAERLFGRPLSELIGTDLGTPAVEGDMAEIE